MNRLSPLKALWGFVFIIAFSPVAAKLALDGMSPTFILIASAVITVLYYTPYLTKNRLWGRFFDKDVLGKMCFLGLIGTALPFLCLLIALRYTTPANSAILNQFEVVYSLLLTVIILRERPTFKKLLGTALVVIGGGVILAGDRFSVHWKGDVIVICTVWMFQIAHIAAKRLPADLEASFISCGRAMFGGLWGIPLAVFLYFFFDMPTTAKPALGTALALLFMGVVRYAVGNAMWYRAIRNMDLAKATALALTYPAFTYLFSVLLGYDALRAWQAAGLALAVAGAWLVNESIKKAKNN